MGWGAAVQDPAAGAVGDERGHRGDGEERGQRAEDGEGPGEGGTQGVKLEQQVVLTENGCASLTGCPFETDWF